MKKIYLQMSGAVFVLWAGYYTYSYLQTSSHAKKITAEMVKVSEFQEKIRAAQIASSVTSPSYSLPKTAATEPKQSQDIPLLNPTHPVPTPAHLTDENRTTRPTAPELKQAMAVLDLLSFEGTDFSTLLQAWAHAPGTADPAIFEMIAYDQTLDWRYRYISLFAMVRLGGSHAFKSLDDFALDPDVLIRQGVMTILRLAKTPHEAHLLKRGLHDPALVVREAAIRSAIQLDFPELLPELKSVFKDPHNFHHGQGEPFLFSLEQYFALKKSREILQELTNLKMSDRELVQKIHKDLDPLARK